MMKQPLVVCTKQRGVFFGYGEIPEKDITTIRLERCRMILAWPEAEHGVMNLANAGPVKGSRVTPPAPTMILNDVDGIMEMTAEAVTQWEKGVYDE